MGRGFSRRRRQQLQLRAQQEKESMRPLEFGPSPANATGEAKRDKTEDSKSRVNNNVSKYNDDYMPPTLRKIMAMKAKELSRSSVRSSDNQNISMEICSTKNKCSKPLRYEQSSKIEYEVKRAQNTVNSIHDKSTKPKASKMAKRNEFLRSKKKKKSSNIVTDSIIKESRFKKIEFGEQAEQPLQSSLKRKHWVEQVHPPSQRLQSDKLQQLEYNSLANLYKVAKRGKLPRGRASIDSLKRLVKQGDTME